MKSSTIAKFEKLDELAKISKRQRAKINDRFMLIEILNKYGK